MQKPQTSVEFSFLQNESLISGLHSFYYCHHPQQAHLGATAIVKGLYWLHDKKCCVYIINVGVLPPVQQSGSYWVSVVKLAGQTNTDVTASD